jgi:hypothetical protein
MQCLGITELPDDATSIVSRCFASRLPSCSPRSLFLPRPRSARHVSSSRKRHAGLAAPQHFAPRLASWTPASLRSVATSRRPSHGTQPHNSLISLAQKLPAWRNSSRPPPAILVAFFALFRGETHRSTVSQERSDGWRNSSRPAGHIRRFSRPDALPSLARFVFPSSGERSQTTGVVTLFPRSHQSFSSP